MPDPTAPDAIPTAITALIYSASPVDQNHNGAPLHLSQNKAVEFLAHFWPAIEAHVRAESVPAWEAVYEPGNVSDYLIGYTNDEEPAKAAAEAWFRSQYLDTVGELVWTGQRHGADFTAWFDLTHVAPDGDESAPGITVRCRTAVPAAGAGQ